MKYLFILFLLAGSVQAGEILVTTDACDIPGDNRVCTFSEALDMAQGGEEIIIGKGAKPPFLIENRQFFPEITIKQGKNCDFWKKTVYVDGQISVPLFNQRLGPYPDIFAVDTYKHTQIFQSTPSRQGNGWATVEYDGDSAILSSASPMYAEINQNLGGVFTIASSGGIIIEGWEFEGEVRPIVAENADRLEIRRNKFKGSARHGIHVMHSKNVRIYLNELANLPDPEWTWLQVKGSRNESTGIAISQCTGTTAVYSNTISGFFNGILLETSDDSCRDVAIQENLIQNAMDDGIEIEDYCTQTTVMNNTVKDSFVGLSLSAAKGSECHVIGNTFESTKLTKYDEGRLRYGECLKMITSKEISNILLSGNHCTGRLAFHKSDLAATGLMMNGNTLDDLGRQSVIEAQAEIYGRDEWSEVWN